VNVSPWADGGRTARVQVTVPAAPADGVKQVYAAGAAKETNVVFAGSVSVSETL